MGKEEEKATPPKAGPIDTSGGEIRLQSASVSSVSEGYSANALVNGAGLDSNGLHSPLFQNMWLSARGKIKGEKVTLHVHKPTIVSRLKIWNYDGPSSATRGVKELSLINDDAPNKVVQTIRLNRANSKLAVEAAQIIKLQTPIVTRSSISLRIESNYGGHYAGLAHVSVYGEIAKDNHNKVEEKVKVESKAKDPILVGAPVAKKVIKQEEVSIAPVAKKVIKQEEVSIAPVKPEGHNKQNVGVDADLEAVEDVKESESSGNPCRCPDIVKEVCGADGSTYVNSCSAKCKKVAIAYEGACKRGLRGFR